jgi:plasmid stability protein
MATIVIRNVDDELHARLKASASDHGRSMEAEARARLRESLAVENPAPRQTLGEAVRAVFGPLGGVEFELPERGEFIERDPPDFSGPEWDRER